jgi:hypothetical protein
LVEKYNNFIMKKWNVFLKKSNYYFFMLMPTIYKVLPHFFSCLLVMHYHLNNYNHRCPHTHQTIDTYHPKWHITSKPKCNSPTTNKNPSSKHNTYNNMQT